MLVALTTLGGCHITILEKRGADTLALAEDKSLSGENLKAIALYRQVASQTNDSRVKRQALYGISRFHKTGDISDDEYMAVLEEASALGHDAATYQLGNIYQNGEIVQKDTAKAVSYYQSISDHYPRARLAILRMQSETDSYGVVEKSDMKSAIALYASQAEKGDTSAMIYLARLYGNGDIVAKDIKLSERWYRKAIEQGNETAASELAWLWLNEQNRSNYPNDGIQLLTEAAEAGSIKSMKDLGFIFRRGINDRRDIINLNKSVKWYSKAANLDDVNSMLNLGNMLIDENYIISNIARRLDDGEVEIIANNDNISYSAPVERTSFFDKGMKWLQSAANKNSAKAMLELGRIYKNGAYGTISKNEVLSFNYLNKSFTIQPEDAAYELADSYDNAIGTNANPYRAARLYYIAAKEGHIGAFSKLGDALFEGKGVEKDVAKAAKYYEISARTGSIGSLSKLAEIYDNGGIGIAPDKVKAASYYERAAATGHVKSIKRLAELYASNSSPLFNREKAVTWHKKAAELGNTSSMLYLANAYTNGSGVARNSSKADYWTKRVLKDNPDKIISIADSYSKGRNVPRNRKTAFKLYLQAAKQGNLKAYIKVADAYSEGRGVKRNQKEALKWYKKAAHSGNIKAANTIAKSYASGSASGSPDMKESFKWYEKAAEAGDSEAYMKIAGAYAVGLGVSQDISKAYEWYEKAAKSGNVEAQYRLGLGYARGAGVEKNMEKAIYWLGKSEKAGYPSAAETLKSLKR